MTEFTNIKLAGGLSIKSLRIFANGQFKIKSEKPYDEDQINTINRYLKAEGFI